MIGETYMLNQDEELWEKPLPSDVEKLLLVDPLADRNVKNISGKDSIAKTRNKYQVVSYKVPHNCAIQIYDYKDKKSRVLFGPELVILGPDEQFTLKCQLYDSFNDNLA